MAYKKYHYRNGKRYGPYYYESYRDEKGIVRKKYVGTVDPSKSSSKKDFNKNKASKVLSNFVGRNVFSGINTLKFFKIFLILFLGLFLLIGFVNLGSNDDGLFEISNSISGNVVSVSSSVNPVYKLTGFAVSEFADEEVVLESFDKEIDLEIKESPKLGDEKVGKNKNDRMEFLLSDSGYGSKNVRLYFDLLNYSEFVESVSLSGDSEALESVEESGYGSLESGYGFTGFFVKLFNSVISLTGRVVDEREEEVANISEVKKIVEELSEDELEVVSDEAVVELDDDEFDVVVEDNASEVEYKWGYNVTLKDLNFMAKIEVSSDEGVVVYDESSLLIGRNLLSFEDLVEEGYSIRFDVPELGMGLEEVEVKVEEEVEVVVNESLEEEVEVNESLEEEVEVNESEVEVVEGGEVEVNESEVEEGNVSLVDEVVVNESLEEEVEVDEVEVVVNESEVEEVEEEVESGYGVVEEGLVLGFFGLIGRVVGIDGVVGVVVDEGVSEIVEEVLNESLENAEVEDLEYVNKVVVYIERDFEGSGVEVGDVVFLDPSLIIIPISDAEHLDVNRNFVSNIYEEVSEQDGNWSEIIGEGEFVRATFEQVLDFSKDVSVYARIVNWSNESNMSANVEVYLGNGNESIAVIENISSEGMYRSYLDGSSGVGLGNLSASVFDLKVVGGDVEFDWIVDPTEANTTCDEGDNLTTCNITSAHNIDDGSVLNYNNVIIKNGGSLLNNTANCTNATGFSNHGCGFSLALTGNLTIESGGNITVGNLSISAEGVDVQSGGLVSVDGLGWMSANGLGAGDSAEYYSGGGSYGGVGGLARYANDGPDIYGNASAPVDFGSGGGDDTDFGDGGGFGGGIIFINVTNNFTIDGNISSNGGPTTRSDSGAGSGGSIWIISDSFNGGGYLDASGGEVSDGSCGDGSGGRIRTTYDSNNFNGIISLIGGRGATLSSAGGFPHPGTYSFPDGNNLTVKGDMALAPGNYSIPYLNVTSGFTLDCQAVNTSDSEGYGAMINSVDMYIESNAIISSDHHGFKSNNGPGAGLPGITGDGGSYGGFGGDVSNISKIYGSFTWPISLGSAGGEDNNPTPRNNGGAGGGMVRLNVSNNLILDGNITSFGRQAGSSAGAGSGGSILIVANNISGEGNIMANGGPSNAPSINGAAEGGGGRVALHVDVINLLGLVEALPGPGDDEDGSAGTIYINASSSLTSIGNITATGYNGTTAMINLTSSSMTLSGVYNATSTVAPNGTITLASFSGDDCLMSLTIDEATFDPDYINGSVCSICDEGDMATTCNITGVHNLDDGVRFRANNLIIKNGGSLLNNTANCLGTSHGCGFGLVLSGNLTIESGGDITAGNVSITAENVDVQSGGKIVTGGLGWKAKNGPCPGATSSTKGGGGGYGGKGGTSTVSKLGCSVPYGNASAPVNFGSGGGYTGGPGGGIIFINATNNVTINGNLNSSGSSGGVSASGGGAGGSIWIISSNFSGLGTLNAIGGNSYYYSGYHGGGGSGGRIAVSQDESYFNGGILLAGGNGVSNGFAGTYSFPEGNNLTVNSDMALAPGNYTIPYLNVTNSATLEVQGDNSTTNGFGVVITGVNVNIDEGSTISGNSLGFLPYRGPGKGGGTSTKGGGASHGGYGGNHSSGGGGNMVPYGSEKYPIELGSGGGYSGLQGTAGGGAIELNMSGNITIDGEITVDGQKVDVSDSGGGGSAGSILLIADLINGLGNLTATGGKGYYYSGYYGGGGGGGRIALHANTINLNSINNIGGYGYIQGSAGTVYINASSSITSSGNITATGYTGATAMINLTSSSMTLSGVYDATSTVAPNGTITLTPVGGCIGYDVRDGTFLPDLINVNPNCNLCDEGDMLTTCNITTTHNIDEDTEYYLNNVIIKNGGSLVNDTSNCVGNHGCGFRLVLSGNLTVEDGGTINAGNVSIVAESVDVQSGGTISTYGLGWRVDQGPGTSDDGGSYGGFCAHSNCGWNRIYGNASAPVDFGSGGGSTSGGGVIFINATNDLIIMGNIASNGATGYYGGGSGGSVWLISNNVSGNGTINARGGEGTYGERDAGGGRIRNTFNIDNFNGIISLKSGDDSGGTSGTYSFPDGNNLTVKGDMALAGGNYSIPYLNITNNAQLEFQAVNAYASDNGAGVIINSVNVFLDSGASMYGTGLGFHEQEGPGYKSNSGGSHGGIGGGSTIAYIYGSETQPLSLGSGGTSVRSAAQGGSALFLNVTGNVTLLGDISSRGRYGYSGGGAGGSIYVVSDVLNISEDSLLRVNGGSGDSQEPGAGGRIALYANTLISSGAIENNGATVGGGVDGSAGTIYINASSSITSSGNITATGYTGTTAWINISSPYMNLSGNYDATASITQNGTFTMNYTDCSSVLSGSFSPDFVKASGCVDCSGNYNVNFDYPLNNSYFNSSSVEFNVSTNLYSNSCSVSINGAANQSMSVNASNNGFNYTNSSIDDGFYNASAFCENTFGDIKSGFVEFVIDSVFPSVEFGAGVLSNGSQTPFSWVFMNVSSIDATSNVSVFIDYDDSLVSWWRMDDLNGSGDLVDYMGKNNGSVFGDASQIVNGKFGKAMEFDGDNDYVEMSVSEDKTSISIWFRNSTSLLWDHVVFNGSNYFVNGVIGVLGEYPLNISGNNFKIGVNGSNDFNGSIDDVMIFNRSLNDWEIAGLYANQSTKYVSGNYTNMGAVWHSFKGYSQDYAGNVNTTSEILWIQNLVNTNLIVYDLEDDDEDYSGWFASEDEPLPKVMTWFFANYSSVVDGSLITGSICNISFEGGSENGDWSNMSYNSSALIYYYNRTFDYPGNYSYNVSCDNSGYEVQSNESVEGDVRIRISLFNQSSLGLNNDLIWVNYNEDINLSVNLSSDIDVSNSGYNVSNVWVQIDKPDSSSVNVSLSGLDGDGADGEIWNASFVNPGLIGNYIVTYFANLTNGFEMVRSVESNFSVQNTSIGIVPESLVVNTTDSINVWGWINRSNSSDSWGIGNNLFLIKINNVSVSSDVYNDSNFSGSWSGINVSNVVQLNLSSASNVEGYYDDFTSQKYLEDNVSSYNVGYDEIRDAVFSYNHMTGIGNITYKFSSVTQFYNMSIYVGTITSSDDSGGNTSIWYSYDNVSWNNLYSSISLGALMGGNVPVKNNDSIYLMIQSDTNSGSNENPVVNLSINYSNYDYDNIGNFVSDGVNLSDVTYTVFSWAESLNGGDINVQIRGSDNGTSWDGWSSNYTNPLTNDISSFNKDFIQYRAWLETSNVSRTPVLSEINISYFNAITNSTGGYNYNITIPTDTLGVQALEVSVNNNPLSGIVGSNNTNLTVWARTNVSYYIEKNYSSSESNYSVHVNFTRTDTGDLVYGDINISIGNGSSWSSLCSGVSQCIASWLVPNDLTYGNYTINITGSNVSAYYINSSNSFGDWLEEKNTTGAMYAANKTLADFSAGTDYSFLWNVSINNSGNASILNPYVYSVTPPTSTSVEAIEYTSCNRIFPNESCNVLMNITLEGGASSGNHRISLRTNWTNNDGNIGPAEGGNYIAYPDMYVIISLNSSLNINQTTINLSAEHGVTNDSKFLVESVGTDVVSEINISFSEGNISDGNNISGSWISINPSSPNDLAAGNNVEISLNVSVPLQTAPGNYSGVVNINSSNGGDKSLNLFLTIPTNASWYFSPITNDSYNYSYPLNTAGGVGNYTINNTGNVNLTLVVAYSPVGTTDYTAFGSDLFAENNDVSGLLTNPTTANISKGSSLIVPIYHKGYSSEVDDVGISILFSNASAVPSSDGVRDRFYIYEAAPEISGMWFELDGVYGNKAEVNKNVTIKLRATDDVSLNDSRTTINVTYGGTTDVLNATSLRLTGGEYDGWTIINFTGNFTPSVSGIHYVVATVYDQTDKMNISSTFNFTSYATTSVQLSQNISSYNVTDVNLDSSQVFHVNYTLNNTGFAYAYDPNITFSKNDSYININPVNYSFGNMSNGSKSSYVFEINVSALTPSGTYNITTTSLWRNPDNSIGSDSEILSVIVASNKSFNYYPSTLNMSVSSNGQNSTVLIINNTGNDVLTFMDLDCYTVSLCNDFTFLANESNFNISANSSKSVNITLIAPQGLTGGVYVGTINVSGTDITDTVNIQSTVPETYTWSASPLLINKTKGTSQIGILQVVQIQNTGNMILQFNLSSTNNSILQPNVSSIIVPVSSNGSFNINYTAPSSEGSYFEKIKITNASYNPVELNVSVNLTVTRINITILSPTSANNISNISFGDLISVNINATYGEEIITNSSVWNVSIGGSECLNTSYNYSAVLGYWNLSCNAPSLDDAITYNLTATISHSSYGETSQISPSSIIYRDNSPPSFNITRNHVDLGGNIDLSVNVTDNGDVDIVWFELIYPNGSVYNWTNDTATNMSLSGINYVFTGLTLNDAGEYLVNYSANDSMGNFNSSLDWFEVNDKYNWFFRLLNYDNDAISDVNVSLYRPSSIYLMNNVTNASGDVVLNVNKRNYDLHAEISKDKVIVRNVNFTNLTENNISFNLHRMIVDELVEGVALHKVFQGFASNSSNLTNDVSAVFNYSGLSYDNSNELEIVKCENWNYSERVCEGSWSDLDSSIDKDLLEVTGNSSGFSAYFLSENKCGNGLCEGTYGETTSTCSADCSASTGGTTTIISGGGGGGGGGLRSGDLARIEEMVKSFLNIGGIKLETTSIYKELFAGDSATFRIKLRNTLTIEKTIVLSTAGDIIPLLFFESSVITLAPKEERDVLIKVVAPRTAEPGNYDGDLILNSGEEEGSIPVTVRILVPEGKLLDVKIQPLTQRVAPGETLRLQTDILNLGKTKLVDVQFDLQLLDVETGEIITRTEEAFAVETSISTIKNLTIPDDTKTGRYMIKATAYYSNIEQSMQASSIAYVRVDYSLFAKKIFGIPFWTYFLVFLIIGLLVGAWFYIKWLQFRKKRFKTKVDAGKLPKASVHSGFVGKVAETGIRAFLDMNKLQTHTLVAGSTGSGKTVAAQGIIEEALLHKKGVIIFDPTAQWTGFLRKNQDKVMLKRYKYFDMKKTDIKAFNGSIKTISDPYELINMKKYLNRPGEITIFNVSHLTPKQIDVVVASTIEQVFKSEPTESAVLKTLIVYDEVHRLLPKFGGSGQGFIQLERGAREFRKWGIGLVLISQVLSDFVGEVKANIGTEIQMGTRYEGDLERVSMKYGEDVLKSVVKEPVGTGMVTNAEYNSGRPYFVSFRPLMHSTKRLSKAELKSYEKYFQETEDLDHQSFMLKKLGVDTLDLKLELKLAKQKIRSGQFRMAEMYLESLRPRFEENWKSLGKKPMHLVRKKIRREVVSEGILKAKAARKKYVAKNPKKIQSFESEILSLKKLIEEQKRKGKQTSKIEMKFEDLKKRLKPYKGKVPANDAAGLKMEVEELKKLIKGL
jgi:uncharacterized membrane protein